MKKYNVTVKKIGNIQLYADSPEEAMRMAEESDEEQMYWEGVTATDAVMSKTFLDVKVGDIVVCYDEYSHDYDEHEMKVESIVEDEEYATETNPKGRVLYGEDLTYGDNSDLMICTVFESNFLRA